MLPFLSLEDYYLLVMTTLTVMCGILCDRNGLVSNIMICLVTFV